VNPTDAVTRILFEAFSGAEVRLFYLLAYAAIAIFFYGVYVQIRKYSRGTALRLEGRLWARLGAMLASVLSHRTTARRDPAAGNAHRLIFYGFVLLFAGTATITLEYDILEPLFGIRFWHGQFYLVFSLILDVAGVALIAGLLFMMYRRGWMRLPKLDYARPDRVPGDPDFNRPQYRREDWAFLWTLLMIGCTGYVLEAARLVWLQNRADIWDTRWWSPVGALVAEGLRAMGLGRAWRRCAPAWAVVVSRSDRARPHRSDSLHKGEAYFHVGGFVDGPRSARRAALAAGTRFAGTGGRGENYRLNLEAVAESRCLHQVRPLP